jgi:hypothetical protein
MLDCCCEVRDFCSAKSETIAGLKAGRSLGLRLLTQLRSRTISLATQVAPALRMLSWMLGQLVIVLPLTQPAETRSQGAWQITAIGLPLASI